MRFSRPLPRIFRSLSRNIALGVALFAATTAQAQLRVDISGGLSSPMPIAIPVMPTPQPVSTPAVATNELGKRVAEVVTNDLKRSGLFRPLSAGSLVDRKSVLEGKSGSGLLDLGGGRSIK